MKATIALWAFVLCLGIIESSPISNLDQKQSVNKHVPTPNCQQHVLKSDVNNKNIAINPVSSNQNNPTPNALNNNNVVPRQINGYPLTNWQQKHNTNGNVVQNWNAQQFNNHGFQYPTGLQQSRNVGANIKIPPWNAFQAASISTQPKLNQHFYPYLQNQWIRNQQLQPPGNHQLNNPRTVTQQISQNREAVAQYHPLQPNLPKIQNQHQVYRINVNTPKTPPVQVNIAKPIVLGTPIGKAVVPGSVVPGQSTNKIINKQVSHSTAYVATNTHPIIATALNANTNIKYVTNGQQIPVPVTKQATGPTKVQSTSTNVEVVKYQPQIVTTKAITKVVKTDSPRKDNYLSAIRRALATAEYAAAAAANAAAGANKAAAVANSAVSEAKTAAAIARRAAADAATAANAAKALMATAGITSDSNVIPTSVSASIASLVPVTSSAATGGTVISNLPDTSSRVPIQKVSQVTLTTADSGASSTIPAISSTSSSATVTKSFESSSTGADKLSLQTITVPTNISKASSVVQESSKSLPISPSKTTKSSESITSIGVKPQASPIRSSTNIVAYANKEAKDTSGALPALSENQQTVPIGIPGTPVKSVSKLGRKTNNPHLLHHDHHQHSELGSTSSLQDIGLDEAKAEYVAELIAKAIAAAITASKDISTVPPTAFTRSHTVIDPNTVTKNLKLAHLVYDGELFHNNDEVVILMND